jgi:hypothetical protein
MDRERRRDAGDRVSDDENEDDEEEVVERKPPVKPVFDEKSILTRFDEKEENALVKIPAEVLNQVDGDWPLTDNAREELIDRIMLNRE